MALNLAESGSNRTEKERVRFFTMALGSLRECEAILELEGIGDAEIKNLLRQLGAILFKLCGINSNASKIKSDQPIPDSDR